MISLKSKITQRVLNHFMLQDGAESYINALARILDVDTGNLTRKLLELEKEGILKSRWQGSQRYFSLNTSFHLFREYKNIVLKTIGFEQSLRDLLIKIPGIEEVYIFGSYAKDQMDSHSDIDLLVVGAHDTIDLQRSIARIQKTLQRDLNVVSMSSQEYRKKQKTDALLKSIGSSKSVRIL